MDISEITINQMRMLVQLYKEPHLVMIVANKSVGAVMKALHQKGLVEKAFKTPSGQYGWKIKKESFTEKDIQTMENYIRDFGEENPGIIDITK